jgi:hypothetical protein
MINLNRRTFLMSILLFGITISFVSANELNLLIDASNMSSKIATKYDKNVIRSRYVRINNALVRYLFEATQSNEKAVDIRKIPNVTLNLFPDTHFIGQITQSKEIGEGGSEIIGIFRNRTGTFSIPITPHIEKMPEEAGYYQIDYIHIEEKMRGFPPRRDFQVWRVPSYSDLYEVVETRYLDRATCCHG